ncbi:hypothetical protein C8R45DRAFT_966191, partial [Mycena sanguinolenta]
MPLPATAAKSQSGRKPATDGFDARHARRYCLAAWVLRPSCTFVRLSRVRSAHHLLALLVVPQPSLPTHLNSGFVARFWKIHRAFQHLDQLRVDDSAWCSADFAFWEPSPPRTSSILSAISTRSFSIDLPACDHHPQTASDLEKLGIHCQNPTQSNPSHPRSRAPRHRSTPCAVSPPRCVRRAGERYVFGHCGILMGRG